MESKRCDFSIEFDVTQKKAHTLQVIVFFVIVLGGIFVSAAPFGSL